MNAYFRTEEELRQPFQGEYNISRAGLRLVSATWLLKKDKEYAQYTSNKVAGTFQLSLNAVFLFLLTSRPPAHRPGLAILGENVEKRIVV